MLSLMILISFGLQPSDVFFFKKLNEDYDCILLDLRFSALLLFQGV
jgi:hypothetical protein